MAVESTHMTPHRIALLVSLCALGVAPRVHADDTAEVDVRGAEYLDVVETADGSIWKGVIVEQTPNVQYKIATADGSLHVLKAADVTKVTRQRQHAAHTATTTTTGSDTSDVTAPPDTLTRHYEDSSGGLPAPYAKSGLRIDPSFAIVIPQGDIQMTNTSFSPSVQAGYEYMIGNVGLEGGLMSRYTYWRLPGNTTDAATTTEMMGYARAALHISRVAIHAGAAAGVDMNYAYLTMFQASKTTLGFGLNLQGGVEVAATPTIALRAGFDYHPGTDTIVDGLPGSVSYYALLIGAGVRL